MKTNQILCSIVIRAYNEEKHIGRLLTGISKQSIKNVEILLVDSGSTDATVALASRHPVKIIQISPEEFTFGYSLNRGIQDTNGKFIVIASAHVYPVFPDWLDNLLSAFKDHRIALSYGKQRGNASSFFSERQIFSQWFPEDSQLHQKHPFCNNANTAIRRSLWEEKQYNESLTGLEDIDWANWAISKGFKVGYVADAEVIHVHNESPRGVYNRYRREGMAFKRIFPAEKFRLWDFLRLFSSNVVSDLWHATRQHELLTNINSIIWFRLMQFWGTYQGYSHAGPITAHLRETFYYPKGLNSKPTQPRYVEPIDYGNI